MKTWIDAYNHLKSKSNPHNLSSSEYRNLTKKVAKIIFEAGQSVSPRGADHSAAIGLLENLSKGLSPSGERCKAYRRAIKELEDDQSKGDQKST